MLKSDFADLVLFFNARPLRMQNGEDGGRVECAESRSQLRVCGVNDGAVPTGRKRARHVVH